MEKISVDRLETSYITVTQQVPGKTPRTSSELPKEKRVTILVRTVKT